MKTVIIAAALSMLWVSGTQAQTRNPFETTDQARQRHNAERYQQQQRSGTPLGGYRERLGDPAPKGTDRPGYTTPQTYGSGSSNNRMGGNWNQKR